MSLSDAEIIERLRRTLDAFSRGDFATAIESAHPDIEVVRAGGGPSLRGVAQFRAWMEPDAFESQVVEPLEFRVAANKVLIRLRNKIHGAGGGIEADFLVWGVWTLDEAALVTRIELFLPHQEAEAAEAAEAAGLRE